MVLVLVDTSTSIWSQTGTAPKVAANTHYTLELSKMQSFWFADLVNSLECSQNTQTDNLTP